VNPEVVCVLLSGQNAQSANAAVRESFVGPVMVTAKSCLTQLPKYCMRELLTEVAPSQYTTGLTE
jgi:hypothetical protein